MLDSDIKEEKLKLIEWLSSVEDNQIIQQFLALQQSNVASSSALSIEQKHAIDQGLSSIDKGEVIDHDHAVSSLKSKYPNFFQ